MKFNILKLNPQKILVVNTFGIGDVLFTTPFLANLKKHFPQCRIDYIGNLRTEEMLKSNPLIRKVYTYERDEYAALAQKSKIGVYKHAERMLIDIRQEKYDILFDFSMNTMFGVIGWVTGIKHRVGFDFKKRGKFLTNKIKIDGFEGKHVAQYYLDMLRDMGLNVENLHMVCKVPEESLQWCDNFLMGKIDCDDVLIGVVAGGGASWGASAKFKQWPTEKFVHLIDKMIENKGLKVILMGDKKDQDICRTLSSKISSGQVIDAVGKTTIAQLAALLKACRVVIANDGGPLHLAVAVGTKTVSIFGPVDEQVYGPYPLDGHKVITSKISCRPCYRKFRRANCDHISCLSSISVNHVYESLINFLGDEAFSKSFASSFNR